MTGLARVVVTAALGGVLVGGVFGFIAASDPASGTLTLDAVPVYACPGQSALGTVYRGDRVLITGRSGEWLAIRDVRGSGGQVYVEAALVVPDSDLSGLPTVDCAELGSMAVATTETTILEDTTTTTAVSEDTTTTVADTTTTTMAGTTTTTTAGTTTTMAAATTTSSSTTSSTTTSSTTTSTTAPDQTPPLMFNAGVAPGTIWELDGGGITCPAQNPRQSTVSVNVTDAGSGVSTVTATWNDPSGGHATVMGHSGSTYSFTFGNYPANTFPLNAPFTNTVTITLTAKDNNDNQAQAAVQVTVTEIGECFG